jgi:hypothetical protein
MHVDSYKIFIYNLTCTYINKNIFLVFKYMFRGITNHLHVYSQGHSPSYANVVIYLLSDKILYIKCFDIFVYDCRVDIQPVITHMIGK